MSLLNACVWFFKRSNGSWRIGRAIGALSLFIVSAVQAANRDDEVAAGAHSIEVYRCDFGEAADTNFDFWPDGWTRLRGPGYPQYLKIGIIEETLSPAQGDAPTSPEAPQVRHCLQIKLDGGSALVSTPPAAVAPRFSYVVDANARTKGLHHDIVSLTLSFLDENKQILQEVESARLTGTTGWTPLKIGPIAPASELARFAVLTFHVRPREREDLRGEVCLSDLRLSRLPQLTLRAEGPQQLYLVREPIKVTTDISGMSAHDNQVVFELVDAHGNVLTEQKQTLETNVLPVIGDKGSLTASSSWSPPVPGPGFYRVNVSMVGEDGLSLKRSITLAVVEPKSAPEHGDFGWTLPDGEKPLDFGPLTTVLSQAGVSWVKFPAWYNDNDQSRADRLAWFAERLGQGGIEMVGLLDQPPPSQAKLFGATTRLPIAMIFTDRDVWEPALDPLMMRLSLKVHWWQFGADDDTSYVGMPNLAAKISELKKSMDRYGQASHLAVVWQPTKPAPPAENASWSVLSYTDRLEPAPDTNEVKSLTAEQISQQFGSPEATLGRRWLSLTPLPQSGNDTSLRVSDLLRRMIAAKSSGIEVTFIPRPFDDEVGLFNADGSPGELFLPWRTTALAISGREHLGAFRLPRNSTNHVFAGKKDAVMVLWNDHNVREHAYLGENVQRVDLWGRQTPLPVETIDGIRQQVIEVGPEPIILSGVNVAIVRWCMGFEFAQTTLESVFGRDQPVAYRFRNTFDSSISGEMTLTSPTLWDTPPQPQRFRMAAGEERKDSFPLPLKPDADSGAQKVRIDFKVIADDEFRFSIFRTLTVGLDEITVELDTHLEESGELVVKAHVTNHTTRGVSFRATVFAPERRRQQQLLSIPAPERATAIYRFPDGKALLGHDLRLRLEELGGSRVLNNHVKAEE
jgi:hypothetical protein